MAENCRNCGMELFVGQRFCRSCGAPTEQLHDDQAPTQIMPPQADDWGARSGASTAPASRPETNPVYTPAGYQPSVPPMYPQPIPPYAPPAKRSPLGWIVAFIAMGLFAAIVLAVMFVARAGRNAFRPPPPPPPLVLSAGEKTLETDADQSVPMGNETALIKTFPLGKSARFSIKNISGSIVIAAWDQPKAEVKVTKRGSDGGSQVIFNNSGGDLSLRTVQTRGNQDVKYEVRLPRQLARIELESVNGSIKLSDVTGQIILGSSNGGIDLTNVVGVSKIQTVNGKITAVLEEASDGPMEFNAVNGKIDLTIKGDFDANLEASTVRGNIDIDDQFGIPVQKEIVGRRASGKLGNGGQPLRVTTVNGSVKLSKQ